MSDDVRLRDVEIADLEVFFDHENDPEAVRRSNLPPRDRETFMTHWRTRILEDAGAFAQTVTVHGEPAGNITSWWDDDKRFVGYRLGRAYWNRGIGTRSMFKFLELETIRPLYADAFPANTASVRLLERCGFRHVGRISRGDCENVMLALYNASAVHGQWCSLDQDGA
jgi:RimJ/RimL family protein N-acetyltransferase